MRANDTTPLVVINQVAPIYVTFSVPGRYLPDIRRYQSQQPLGSKRGSRPAGHLERTQVAPQSPVRCRRDATDGGCQGRPPPTPVALAIESGRVSFIDNTVDSDDRYDWMKGTFSNDDHALWPGLFVQVTCSSHRSERHRCSVSGCSGIAGRTIRVCRQAGSDGRNSQHHRRTAAGRGEWWLRRDCKPGEEVVTDGQLRLTAGARVTTGHARRKMPAVEAEDRGNGNAGDGGAVGAEAGIGGTSHEFR